MIKKGDHKKKSGQISPNTNEEKEEKIKKSKKKQQPFQPNQSVGTMLAKLFFSELYGNALPVFSQIVLHPS